MFALLIKWIKARFFERTTKQGGLSLIALAGLLLGQGTSEAIQASLTTSSVALGSIVALWGIIQKEK